MKFQLHLDVDYYRGADRWLPDAFGYRGKLKVSPVDIQGYPAP
jgi:hypothetical protein